MEQINGPLDEDYLATQEQFFNFKFPREYREFLLRNNGGIAKKKIFLFKEDLTNGSILDKLFGFTPKQYENILVYFRNYKDRVPPNTFPIGYDPGGNLVLISVKGTDRGKVYFWDHEMEADTERGEIADYSNLTLVADSFNEFINSLKDESEIEGLA